MTGGALRPRDEARVTRDTGAFRSEFDTLMAVAPGALVGVSHRYLPLLPGHVQGLVFLGCALSVLVGESAIGPVAGRVALAVLALVVGAVLANSGGGVLVLGVLALWAFVLWSQGVQLVRRRRETAPVDLSLTAWVLGLAAPVLFFVAVPAMGPAAGVAAFLAGGLSYLVFRVQLGAFRDPPLQSRLALGALGTGWGMAAAALQTVDPRGVVATRVTGAVLALVARAGAAYLHLLDRNPGAAVFLGILGLALVQTWAPRSPTLASTPGGGARWAVGGGNPAPPALAGPDEIRILDEAPAAPVVTRAGGETECPYCATPMPRAEAVACCRCHTWHHRDCWQESGRCTTYGCGGVASEAVA